MAVQRTHITILLAFTSVVILVSSAVGQSQAPGTITAEKGVTVPEATPGVTAAKAIASPTPAPDDLADQVAAIKAENSAVMEQLREMAAQQKALLEQVDEAVCPVQRKLEPSHANIR